MSIKTDIKNKSTGSVNTVAVISQAELAQAIAVEDKEVIRLVLAGDVQRFTLLVDRYKEKVIRLCVSLISDVNQAEDAAQEVFLKAYRGLANFRMDASFSTWLYRITSNHCMDILRKNSKKREYSWETMLENVGEQVYTFLVTNENHTAQLENKEVINQVLDHLNHDYRQILTLREMDRMSYEEISGVLSISVNAVKSRLRRARRDFEHKLAYFNG